MKLGEFETPTGQKGNVLSIDSWIKMILGGLMLIVTFATSQNVAKALGGRVGFLDTEIDKPYKDPVAAVPQSRKRVV